MKRDLVSISYEALVEFFRNTKFREAAAVMQSMEDSYHNISDEWRVLLEDQEASWRGDLAVLQEELRAVEAENTRQDERARRLEQEREAAIAEKDRLVHLVEALQQEKEALQRELKSHSLANGRSKTPASARSPGSGTARALTPNGRTASPARPMTARESPASGRLGSSTTPSRTRTSASPASARASAAQDDAALNKMLTLKQLKDCIKELYESKLKSDAVAKQGAKPRATMEEHLYAHYTTKLGIRSVILIHIERILKAVDKYGADDFGVSLFAKILANEIEEEFYYELLQLEREVKDQLRALLRIKFNEKPKEFIAAQLDIRVRGDIHEDEARTLIMNMQDPRERDTILERLNQFLKSKEKEKPRVNYSDPVEYEQPETIKFDEYISLVTSVHTEMHERAIRGVTEAFREVDRDRAGWLSPEQFAEFCKRISVEGDQVVTDEEVARLLDVLDPFHVRRVTFSTCVYELAGDLMSMSAVEA